MDEKIDLTFIDDCIGRIGCQGEHLLALLHAIQGRWGYLPKEALEYLGRTTGIKPATIWGVSTFYDRFRHRPVGEHIIRVCVGTACHVKGSQQVCEGFARYLNIPAGQDTSPDGLFTIQPVACLGCCTLAPAAQIGDITYGHLSGDTVADVIRDFFEYEQAGKAAAGKRHEKKALRSGDKPKSCISGRQVRIGLGSCCVARGSGRVHEALTDAIEKSGIEAKVECVGCVGMCHQTPLLEIVEDGRSCLYAKVMPEDAGGIIRRHFPPAGAGHRIGAAVAQMVDNLLEDRHDVAVERYSIDVREEPVREFLGSQVHIATRHCGTIDPVDIGQYIENGGFAALEKALKHLDSGQIIEQIRQSGLRGRGGAGFATHLKWSAVAAAGAAGAAAGDKKFVIANGDEGDPGAFMDRMLMESYPFRIIEGIAIAARAVGSDSCVFYIRAEYPLAVRRIGEAIRKCREKGLLGSNILGSDFSLEIKITEGAGAFVCGEETALIASIEGRRGMPRFRPPYPAQSGLWNRPTLVNNVETYALVPSIIRDGGAVFAKLGAGSSRGTKVFALAGKIARGGLIEVPMGITIGQIVYDIGGGVSSADTGGRFKAVQVGGPSGGCVPAVLGDTPVDYESLVGVGAIMGSGGLVVLDDGDCMVDIARYFLEFTQNQSCGKCTFCRIGTRRMLDILERLCGGEGKKGDIEELETLALMVKDGSLCGLGKTAPNPVLSTIRYFRDEYEAHIQGRCRAGVCRKLITYTITDDCIGCTLCAQHCPVSAIEAMPYEKHQIQAGKCIRCGTCRRICPAKAVKVE